MAIKFYRAFEAPIKLLSFDLDDTLYQNEYIIQQAEQAQYDAIGQLLPVSAHKPLEYWITLKWQVAKRQPELCHDVTRWRRAVIRQGLSESGVSGTQLDTWQELVFAEFYRARSNFSVAKETLSILAKLGESLPIVAVTNGNADVDRIGLAGHIKGYYRAGERNTKSKPAPDLLHHVATDFQIETRNILHIGDNVGTDIGAAHAANSSSLWFNPTGLPYPSQLSLPNGEYSHLADLLDLL